MAKAAGTATPSTYSHRARRRLYLPPRTTPWPLRAILCRCLYEIAAQSIEQSSQAGEPGRENSVVYTPHPIATSDVELDAEILDLTELLARNTHEVWAQQRMAEGWIYGPSRNDVAREHPCLVPYDDLSESEKEYDRKMAQETLKVILALGYQMEKRNR
jgi:hypothetical protein